MPPVILQLCRYHHYFVVKLQRGSNITGGTLSLPIILVLNNVCVCVSAEGRVEHKKLNQVAALQPPSCVFSVQLDYSCRKKGKRWSGPRRCSLYEEEE